MPNQARRLTSAERKDINTKKENMRKAAQLFKKQQNQYKRVQGLGGGQQMYDELIVFLKTYSKTIREYGAIDEHFRGSDAASRELLENYKRYIGDDNTAPTQARPQEGDSLSATLDQHSALTKDTQAKVGQLRDVTDRQKEKLNDIAQWMYRNGEERHQAFIGAILRKSDREKLFMYYIIEKGKRKNPNQSDFSSSQKYEPNLDAFKKQMVASKLKIWKRMPWGNEVYWRKLEDAAHQATSMRAMFRAYAGVEPEPFAVPAPEPAAPVQVAQQQEQQNEQGNENANAQQQNANAGGNAEGWEPVDPLIAERNAATSEFLEALKAHQKNLAEIESKGNAADQNRVTESANTVGTAFRRLIAADKAVENQYGVLPPEVKPPKNGNTAKSVKTTAEKLSDINKKYAQGPFKEAANIGKSYFSWELSDIESMGVDLTNKGLSSLVGVTTLIGLFAELFTIKRDWSKNMGSSNAMNVIGAIKKFIGGSKDLGTGTVDILGKLDIVAEHATEVSKTVGGIGNVVTGAMDMGLGIAKITRAGNSRSHITSSVNAYQQRRQEQGGEKTNDDRREENLQNMLRNKFKAEQKTSAIDIVAGGLKVAGGILTATGVGALAGAILASAGFVVGWVSTITGWVLKRKNREKAVEDYIGLDQVMAAVKQSLGNNWKDRIKQFGLKNEKALRERVRYELLSRIDCRNVSSAYRYIVRQYAEMLYRKLFFKSNGRMFTEQDRTAGDREFQQVQAEFGEIVKSLKIRPKYPAGANGTPSPTVDALMGKLM